MSKLSFRLAFRTTELQNLDLPVEIRKPNLALVAKTLASKTIEVKPGTYFVSATLPAGQELYTQVTVEGAKAEATLEPQLESPSQSREKQLFMGGMLIRSLGLRFASDSASEVPHGNIQATVGLLRGTDPRTAIRARLPIVRFEELTGGVQFRIPGHSSPLPQLLEFLRPHQPALHVALPVSEGQMALVVVRPFATENVYDLRVDVHLSNSEADLLLSGLSGGYLREASEALNSDQVSAEKLLYAKAADPFAAAVGAYALLQFGELDRLHGWTENLMTLFPRLPDGLTIRGEHLARIGRHQEAIEILAQVPARGVPQFSAGLSYALNRLRVYARPTRTDFSDESVQKARDALDFLEPIAGFVDFRRPVLTTVGLRSDAEYPAGVDIGQYC